VGQYYFNSTSGHTYSCESTNMWTQIDGVGSSGVLSLNTLTGNLMLVAGTNMAITPSGGNTFTFTAAGSGGSGPANTQLTDFSTALTSGTVLTTNSGTYGIGSAQYPYGSSTTWTLGQYTITSITTGTTTTLATSGGPSSTAIHLGDTIYISGATGTGCSGLNGLQTILNYTTGFVLNVNTTGCTYTGSSATFGANPGASGTGYIYGDKLGNITLMMPASAGLIVNGSQGLTIQSATPGFGSGSWPIAQFTLTSTGNGNWSTVTDERIFAGTTALIASTGMLLNEAGGVWTVGIDPSVVSQLGGGNVWTGANDFSNAISTSPMKVGSSNPATCTQGQQFFNTGATAGANLYGCTALNTWTVESGGGGGSSALSAITAATGSNTIASGNNPQVWNWAQTTNNQTAFTYGETTAATGTGDIGVAVKTLAGSTAIPLSVANSLTGSQTLPALSITPTWNTTGVVDAALLVKVTNTASGTGSLLEDLQVGGTSQWSADKAGNTSQIGNLTTGSTGADSGLHVFYGKTSGAVALGAADVAGTAIVYVLPSTNGTSGQFLSDLGAATCPTYVTGAPTTCHQTAWEGPSMTPITYANWSTIGTGCTFTQVTGATGGNAWQILGTSAGTQNFCGKSIAASGTFSHTFLIYPMIPIDTGTAEVAVGFSNGMAVEYCSATWDSNDGAFTNGITLATLSGATPGSASAFPYYAVNGTGPVYFQLSATSGTNLTCKISPDGVNWVQTIFADSTPFLTPSELVVGIDSETATHAATVILESYQ
jgi:hypothetical protein